MAQNTIPHSSPENPESFCSHYFLLVFVVLPSQLSCFHLLHRLNQVPQELMRIFLSAEPELHNMLNYLLEDGFQVLDDAQR